jgi:hypothetical protein
MSDITLTSGIRQNLLSLQQTSADLNTTQEALATGKAVNSAADNPSAYFTSQNLTNSANSLSALLDQIGQGQQTINAATNGLSGITSLLQQALSTVQQAQQAAQTSGSTTGTVDVTSTAVPSASAGNLLISVGSSTYTVAITASEAATSIVSAINGTTGLGSSGAITASTSGGDIILTANSGSTSFSVTDNATSEALGLTASATGNSSVYGTSSTRTTLQLQRPALADQPARWGLRLQRRQSALRQ